MSDANLLGAILASQVKVESLPASCAIVAVERQIDGTWRVCGSGQSNADGLAEIAIQGRPESLIYAVAVGEWGLPWISDLQVEYGAKVRPSVFSGWLYRVTQAGVLPTEEPDWWSGSLVGPQPVGTAMLEAVRYYQPIAHGPIALDFEEEFDPYWVNVVSLMHFDDYIGSTNFTDAAGRVWSATGAPSIASSPSAFGGRAGVFASSGEMIATGSGDALNFAADDFTIEGWYTPQSLPPENGFRGIVCKDNVSSTRGWLLTLNSAAGNAYRFAMFSGATAYTVTSLSAAVVGERVHLAVTREGGVLRLFVEGVLQESKGVGSLAINSTAEPMVYGSLVSGGAPAPTWSADGLLDEWRITRGVARYTANFTPRAAPFADQ